MRVCVRGCGGLFNGGKNYDILHSNRRREQVYLSLSSSLFLEFKVATQKAEERVLCDHNIQW